jgi:hypothetical protein
VLATRPEAKPSVGPFVARNLTGDVCPDADLAALPTRSAPMSSLCVDAPSTSWLLALAMPPEGLIDDLGVGHTVESCLPADGVDPALFDMEGRALGLPTGIAGLVQGRLALLPPGHQRLQIIHHPLGPPDVDPRSTFGGRCCGGGLRGSQGELLQMVTDCRLGPVEHRGVVWGSHSHK